MSVKSESGKWRVESGKSKGTIIFFLSSLFFIFHLPPSTFHSPLAFAEVSKSEKFTLQAGGFVSASGSAEGTNSKVQAGALSDFSGTTTTTTTATLTVNPGLVQLLTETEAISEYPYDIKEVYAKESVGGTTIESATWQEDNDPYFYWTVYGPSEGVEGYSFAIDSAPDETLEVNDSSFSYTENNISDGKHIFRVIAQSTAGKWGREGVFEFWVDATAPSIISFVPGNKALLNTATPQIQIHLQEEASGVDPSTVVLKVNRSKVNTVFDAEQKLVTYTPGSGLREGSNSIMFDVKDKANNTTATLVWSFTVDTKPPTGSILINNGDPSTTSITVKLDLKAEDQTTSVTEMMISNQSDFSGARWETFNPLKDSWTLTPLTGERTVYVKFKDEVGNESTSYSDSIELIIIAPDTTITSGPSGITDQTSATLTYSASEAGCFFRYQIDAGEWSEWTQETLVTFSDLGEGNHYFQVKAGKDVDGNGTIDPDEEDPTPATRHWSVSSTGGTEAAKVPPEKPVKYWYKE